MVQTLSLQTDYGETIFGNVWLTDKKALGNVIIIHGMAEHSLRYDRFAKFLNDASYNVFAIDQPGHGKNVTLKGTPLRQYGEWPLNGFDLAVAQVHALNKYIRSINNLKIVAFGHSMGSFVCQRYYQLYSEEIDGVIICGSSSNTFSFRLSRAITAILRPFISDKKRRKPSKFFANLQNQGYNKDIKEDFEDGYKSIFKWISFNEDNVKRYDEDEGCGFTCSFNFYYSVAKGLQKTFKKSSVKNIKNKLPLFIISGKDDPVGGYGKYVNKLKDLYSSYQKDVSITLYDKMRHEVLNEDGYMTVQNDILNFISKIMK